MKTLNEYITEKLFSKTTVEFVHHILDILYELTYEDNTNKNFGIKFDEIANNVGNHLYKMSKTLQELERGKYIKKVKDGYKVLLTAYTENNTIPCEKSVEIDILIPNEKRMNKDYSDENIKEKIFDAVKDLKKIAKLY
jgi:hypothetical protein